MKIKIMKANTDKAAPKPTWYTYATPKKEFLLLLDYIDELKQAATWREC